MARKTWYNLAAALFILASSGCTIRGLPYPSATPHPALITPDLDATREIAEAGMFPSSTPAAVQTQAPPAGAGENQPTATGRGFLIPSQTLKMVYIQDGDLWYWEEGREKKQLSDTGDAYLAAISSDAAQAAFARELDFSTRELWAVHTDGSGARRLLDAAAFQRMKLFPENLGAAPLQLAWLPGTELVLFSTRIIAEGPGTLPKHELRSIHAASRTMTVLADFDAGGEFTVSPDGSKIGISLPDRISLVNPDGSGLRELYSFTHINTGSEWWYYPPLAWTPDSGALRALLPPPDPRAEPDQPSQLLHLPLDGASPRILGEVLTVPVFFGEAVFSPDTRQLAYLGPHSSPEPGSGILYTLATDGSGVEIHDEGEIRIFAWSPDSRHFIYSINGLNKIGSRDGPALPLDEPGTLTRVDFVDPARFLYQAWSANGGQLWLADLGGGRLLLAESSSTLAYDFVR